MSPRLGIKEGPAGWEEADVGTMEIQRDSRCLGWRSLLLLLLGLVIPPATAQALSYEEAVLRAVDGLNRRSSDDNLYRLLELDQPPKGAQDPDTPTPVSFTVKETVCPKTTQQPLEQCDFKENGLVKQCVGTVILDPAKDYFDISCDDPQRVRRRRGLRKFFGKVRQKIHDKVGRIRDKIGRFRDRIGGIFQSRIVLES